MTPSTSTDWLSIALSGTVVVDIGQIDDASARRLNAAAKRGDLSKWRGYWYPVAGGCGGIGPLKTCWGKLDAEPGPDTAAVEQRAAELQMGLPL